MKGRSGITRVGVLGIAAAVLVTLAVVAVVIRWSRAEGSQLAVQLLDVKPSEKPEAAPEDGNTAAEIPEPVEPLEAVNPPEEQIPDPFEPYDFTKEPPGGGVQLGIGGTHLHLTGIIMSVDRPPKAMIDDYLVKEGDVIEDRYFIEKITEQEVIIRDTAAPDSPPVKKRLEE